MTTNDRLRLLAVVAITAAVAWASDSVAWGLVAGLGAVVLYAGLQYRRLVRWSRRPLTRPGPPDPGWRIVAHRLHRTIRSGRERSRKLLHYVRALQRTAEAVPDGWSMVRKSGEIEDFNQAAARLLGLSSQDRGQNILTLVRDPSASALFRGAEESEIVEIAAPADDTRRLELRRVLIDGDRTLIVVRDITELNRALTMRQDFVANVSHELRTPLTVIVGYLEQSADADADTVRTILPKLTSPVRRMQALVDDLLTLTRLESGGMPDEAAMEYVDVSQVLHIIASEARGLSGGRHRLTLQADEHLGIRGMPGELYSAFANLITNAVRYSPDGGNIDVRWFDGEDGPRFEVRDQGMGIAPEHLTRLTERFYRIDLAPSRVRGGTGLGLAIVKHVLRRHGSVLRVESELGKGSLFFCEFPASAMEVESQDRDVERSMP
ncbi:MAG: phosphate regulon sensor histidine kinase PhoR [Gammaproteobacteria bacterium]|nr:phosphate regulon sensor histidine kinase PhoR [Gammaproteobacteria bacterium]